MSQTEVKDESSHNWRTEIPNILIDLGLDPYEFRLYCEYKRIAGDGGNCTRSNKNIAASCKMSDRTVQRAKKTLTSPFQALDNEPLIRIQKRKTSVGDPDTDLVTILDVWDVNFKVHLAKKNIKEKIGGDSQSPGVATHSHQGGDSDADKEEPFKKNPSKEEFVAEDPVGSPLQKISFLGKNGEATSLDETEFYRKIVNNAVSWSSDEIKYAWEALANSKFAITDWWLFIQGTVKNHRNSLKSKRASGEKVSKSPNKKSQKEGKKSCKTNISQKQKDLKETFSENDSPKQHSRTLFCLRDILPKEFLRG